MVRAVTFWYTKELSTFENNEDLPSPKIDVTRYTVKKVSDILAGDGNIANLFLQCRFIKMVFPLGKSAMLYSLFMELQHLIGLS